MNKGFMLVEWSFVGMVIALLAFIVVPNIMRQRAAQESSIELISEESAFEDALGRTIRVFCDRERGHLLYQFVGFYKGGLAVVQDGCKREGGI